MGKRTVIFLVLFLFLLGVQGCVPPAIDDFGGRLRGGGEEVIRIRGFIVEFIPKQTSIRDGEFDVRDKFIVGLKISNYLLEPISGNVKLSNLGYENYGGVKDEGSFSVEGAVVQGGKRYPQETELKFTGRKYDEKNIGNEGFSDTLNVEVEVNYDAEINVDLCFSNKKDEAECNNDEILTENMLKGDVKHLPVSINKIEKYVYPDEGRYTLDIMLENFGKGKIENDKLDSFSASGLKCDTDDPRFTFRDGGAEIKCEGSVSLAEGEEFFEPVNFNLAYKYKMVIRKNYLVIKR